MDREHHRLLSQSFAWLLAFASLLHLGLEVASAPPLLRSSAVPLTVLAFAAAAAAWLSSVGPHLPAPRVSLSFVLAALVALPPPAGLIVAAAAGIAGAGGGVAGTHRRGVQGLAPVLVAVSIAQFFARTLLPSVAHGPLALLRIGLYFLLIQGFSFALSLLLADETSDPEKSLEGTASWRITRMEALTVPLGFILAALLAWNAILPAIVTIALALVAQRAVHLAERSSLELRRATGMLAERVVELDTLHAIGREVLSSRDVDHLFASLERECRKIFDVDVCSISLLDAESVQLRSRYVQVRGSAARSSTWIAPDPLTRWALEHKRGRRIDDIRDLPVEAPERADLEDPQMRSLMAAPMIVEGTVLGVLAVGSRQPAAYDDHHLSVLTTVAQQAAVALENAHHYELATLDSLTGFYVRDYFFRRLDEEDKRVRRYGGRFAVLMVDLDGFKEINDRNGHLAGDLYLTEITRTIRDQLRGADTPCRYGGDEFCVLLPETDLAGARAIAERIRTAVSRRIVGLEGLALRTTVSIGLAAYPEHDSGDLKGLLRAADEALYRAKRGGRDRVVPFAA